MRWYQKRKNLNVILSDESDLKDPPRLDDDVVDGPRRQQVHVALLAEEAELPARPVGVHQVDVLVATDAEQTET